MELASLPWEKPANAASPQEALPTPLPQPENLAKTLAPPLWELKAL